MECAGLSQPLFVLRGSCLGMEIVLDTDALPFGTVYQRSQTTRKLIMTNSGDMNTRYGLCVQLYHYVCTSLGMCVYTSVCLHLCL